LGLFNRKEGSIKIDDKNSSVIENMLNFKNLGSQIYMIYFSPNLLNTAGINLGLLIHYNLGDICLSDISNIDLFNKLRR